MNTNRKQYLKNIEVEIINAIDELEGNTTAEKLQTMVNRFDSEYNYHNNKLRTPNRQQRFGEWLQGGAIDIPLYWSEVNEMAKRVHETDLITDFEFEKIQDNYFNHMAYHSLRVAEKFNINLNNL